MCAHMPSKALAMESPSEARLHATEHLGLPTIGELIELPEFRKGHPVVEAGQSSIGRPVRWVHVSELADIGNLLKGGELILSTGIALPNSRDGLTKYIDDLASAGVAGLVIELGRRFSSLPPELVLPADRLNMPLISLRSEVQYVTITEAVHSAIVNSEIRQLQLRDTIHSAFRDLATEAESPQDIIDRMAELANCPVIFESVNRHVLSYSHKNSSTALLENWEVRSREAGWSNHTEILGIDKWLATPVSARGHAWGRLIFIPSPPLEPHLTTIIEQGAITLALHLLLDHEQSMLEHQTHRSLIGDIIHHRYTSEDDVHNRAQALGVSTRRKTLIAMILRFPNSSRTADIVSYSRARDTVVAVTKALADIKAPGLAGILDPERIALFLTTSTGHAYSTEALLDNVTQAIRQRARTFLPDSRIVIGVGSNASSISELRHSFSEAEEAADASMNFQTEKPYATTADIHLRGLIYLLRDDQHLQRYAERELGTLIAYDKQHHSDLTKMLAAYLETGGNKSLAAGRANISRATLYSHIEKIESILHCNLDNPDWRYSLFVALLTCQCLA